MNTERGYQAEELSLKDKARIAAGQEEVLQLKNKKNDDFTFPEGTNPGITTREQAEAELNHAETIAGSGAFSKEKDELDSIMAGLDTAAEMSQQEQKNWAKLVPGSKKIRLREQTGPFAKATEEGKLAGARRKVMIADTLKADEVARKQADDDRWEAAELSARKRIGEEEQAWEDKELEARRKLGLEAHAKDEARNKNKLSISNLMKRLGLGKKESK